MLTPFMRRTQDGLDRNGQIATADRRRNSQTIGWIKNNLMNSVQECRELGITRKSLMGDLRELDLETRVTANGDNKTPRCFTVVH